MPRARLIHWNQEEAAQGVRRLQQAGYEVDFEVPTGPEFFRELKKGLPDVIVIDLTRLPSHGRDVGMALRKTRATRAIPLLFLEGDPEKVARIQAALPDASFTTWRRIRGVLKRVLADPPQDPIVPESQLAGYSGTPLPKKLGIKSGMVVVLLARARRFSAVSATVARRGEVPPPGAGGL